MSFVVDASVGLSWLLRDETSARTDFALAQLHVEGAAAPTLWPLEIANGLLVAERRGRLTPEDASVAAEFVRTLPVKLHDLSLSRILGPIRELANHQRLTIYDAGYLDLAMREGLAIATLDGALVAAAKQVGVPLLLRRR